jgi:hypothetical protein
LIAIAAGIVHLRSHRVSTVAHWYGEKSWLGVYCCRGKLVIGIGRERIDSIIKHDFYERPVKTKTEEIQFDDTFHGGQWLGVGYYQSNLPTVGYVRFPLWLIWTLTLLPILFAIRKRLTKRVRRFSNRCINCGYDLRSSGEKCPECGQELPRSRPIISI